MKTKEEAIEELRETIGEIFDKYDHPRPPRQIKIYVQPAGLELFHKIIKESYGIPIRSAGEERSTEPGDPVD